MLGCSVNSWFVAKPDESPVHFPAGFHFDDYPVNQDLKNLIANVDAELDDALHYAICIRLFSRGCSRSSALAEF